LEKSGEERTTPAFGHPSFVRRGAKYESLGSPGERPTPSAEAAATFVRRGAKSGKIISNLKFQIQKKVHAKAQREDAECTKVVLGYVILITAFNSKPKT
jgi:hypothetical protein